MLEPVAVAEPAEASEPSSDILVATQVRLVFKCKCRIRIRITIVYSVRKTRGPLLSPSLDAAAEATEIMT